MADEAVQPQQPQGPVFSIENVYVKEQAAEGTPYSQEYLSLLARKGRLEALKRGRVWLTTRKAVADYCQSIVGVNS